MLVLSARIVSARLIRVPAGSTPFLKKARNAKVVPVSENRRIKVALSLLSMCSYIDATVVEGGSPPED